MNTAGLGVCLSPGSEPVPQKLVDKVCSGAYVDMKELLGDNISLLRQLESLNIAQTLPALPGSISLDLERSVPWHRGSTVFWPMLHCDAQTKSPEIIWCMLV